MKHWEEFMKEIQCEVQTNMDYMLSGFTFFLKASHPECDGEPTSQSNTLSPSMPS